MSLGLCVLASFLLLRQNTQDIQLKGREDSSFSPLVCIALGRGIVAYDAGSHGSQGVNDFEK